MKKRFLSFLLIVCLFTRQGLSQATNAIDPVAQLLTHYYGISDALAAGNSASATTGAGQFIKTLNSIDYKVISEGNINVLLKDATLISESGDLQQQRARFANLSDNLVAVSRVVRLSTQPVYLVHCPVQKVSWLSSEKSARNPYGNGLPACGEVVETIQ